MRLVHIQIVVAPHVQQHLSRRGLSGVLTASQHVEGNGVVVAHAVHPAHIPKLDGVNFSLLIDFQRWGDKPIVGCANFHAGGIVVIESVVDCPSRSFGVAETVLLPIFRLLLAVECEGDGVFVLINCLCGVGGRERKLRSRSFALGASHGHYE